MNTIKSLISVRFCCKRFIWIMCTCVFIWDVFYMHSGACRRQKRKIDCWAFLRAFFTAWLDWELVSAIFNVHMPWAAVVGRLENPISFKGFLILFWVVYTLSSWTYQWDRVLQMQKWPYNPLFLNYPTPCRKHCN